MFLVVYFFQSDILNILLKDYDIIIIGAGVAGLASANALAYNGIKSLVIEKSRTPGEVDRGDVIHQSIINSFVKWGISDAFEAYTPIRFQKFQILNNFGKIIFSYDLSKDFRHDTNFTVLKHPDIERFLEASALKTKLVIVNRREVCVDLLFDNDRVIGVVTNKNTYKAQLIIVANGSSSIIRDKYFGKPNHYEYPVTFYNGCFEIINKFNNSAYYVLGKKGVLIILPLPKSQMRIGIQLFKGNKVSSENIEEIILGRLHNISKNDLKFINGHIYRIFKSMSQKWYIPGAILLGDAAHTVHPIGGQGMNLAFQDAEILGCLLKDKRLNDSHSLDEACIVFEKRRKKEVKKVMRRTHLMGKLGMINNSIYIFFREKLIQIVNYSPYFKRKLFDKIIHIR